jgi:hypothetical protein
LTIHAIETILCSKIENPFGNHPFIGAFGQLDSKWMFCKESCKGPGHQAISSCRQLNGICPHSRRERTEIGRRFRRGWGKQLR